MTGGIIYQLCVVEPQRRGLIGAALVKAMFERAAWGCRLFCCWCAQDIEANHFWESLGFVPLAFRTGSRTKGKKNTPRIHIFWQKRIREGDATTPWWFPSETKGGSIREDRLVLPIPLGTHWSEVKQAVLPSTAVAETVALPEQPRRGKSRKPVAPVCVAPPGALRGFYFVGTAPPPSAQPKAPKPRVRNDPRYVAFARELRDRWVEAIQQDPSALLPQGKYILARQLRAANPGELLQLPAAA